MLFSHCVCGHSPRIISYIDMLPYCVIGLASNQIWYEPMRSDGLTLKRTCPLCSPVISTRDMPQRRLNASETVIITDHGCIQQFQDQGSIHNVIAGMLYPANHAIPALSSFFEGGRHRQRMLQQNCCTITGEIYNYRHCSRPRCHVHCRSRINMAGAWGTFAT